jgi:hypothetical protein
MLGSAMKISEARGYDDDIGVRILCFMIDESKLKGVYAALDL